MRAAKSSATLGARGGELARVLVVSLSFLGLWAGLPGAAHAAGFHNEDFGTRRMGMFCVVAKPDDGTAVFHNPAGLVLSEGTQLYHSQSWFFASLGIRLYDSEGVLRPEEEIHPDWNIGFLPFVGVSSDLGMERLRVGLSTYAPNAYGAVLPEDEPTRYHATRALFVSGRATLTGAYEVSDRFAVGANLSLVHNYLTLTRAFSMTVMGNPDARFRTLEETRDEDMELTLDGRSTTWAWDLGVLFRPTPTLHIGFGFFSGSEVNLEGDVTLTEASGEELTTTHRTTLVIPFTLRAGINWELAPRFELAADVRWYHYQVFQEQRTTFADELYGLTELVDPKNYTNAINWSVGMLYGVTETLELMCGFQVDHTPIPSATFTLDNPTRDQRGVGLGLRWQATDDQRFGLAFVRNWFDLLDVQDSVAMPPHNAKGYGSNTELGFDYTLSW